MPTTLFAVAALAVGCASVPIGAPTAVARGGDLRVEELPSQNVQVSGDRLVAWASTEVPAGSRLQMALAGLDAITRAELIKYLRVCVASSMLDVVSDKRQQIELRTAEAARAGLPHAHIDKGWEKRGDVLVLVGRMEVTRSHLREMLEKDASLAPHIEVILKQMYDRSQ